MAEAFIVAHAGCCITPQALRLLNHALVCQEGVAFDNAYQTDSLEVTEGDLGLTVIVAAGSAFIEGANFAGEGMYFVSNDGPVTLTLDPADTDPRCDLVIAQVDGNATDCDDAWVLTTITGVPTPGDPTCPEVPDGSIALATVLVPPGATSVLPANITDQRQPYQSCNITQACRLSRNTILTVPHGTFVTIPFTTETFDDSNMHIAGDTRITFNVPGFYTVGMGVEMSTNPDFTRVILRIVLNGSTIIVYTSTPGVALNVPQRFATSTMYEFAAGDYIEAQVYHANEAEGSRSVFPVPEYSPYFYAARIGG